MAWSRKLAVYLVAVSMVMWQSSAALAAPANGKGQAQGGKPAAASATVTPESEAPECLAEPAEGEATCLETEQPAEPEAPAQPAGKGKANVDLNGKGKAAAKNPNAGAEGKLAPAAHIAAVKDESRELAKTDRAKGEKGAYLVYVNGERLNLTPIARSGRTLVPFRALAENLGATVEWVPSTQTVIMTKGDVTVELSIGSGMAKINGEELELQTPPELVEGRTFVPLRFIAEALGADVDYDPETGAITVITLPGYEPGEGDEDDATEGGDDATEGGDDATEGGDDASEGDDDATEGGDDATEGGDDATEGDGESNSGN